jgi:hypothetical protein
MAMQCVPGMGLMLFAILGLGCSMQLDYNKNFKVVPKQEVYLAGVHNNF